MLFFFYTALSFCDHCYRFFGSEDTVFECQQCPINFTVCSQCYPLMSTHHPSVHTFSKILSADVTAKIISNFYHIGISCDGCSIKSFNGRRYQCEQCPSSYDLCENCFGKEHTHHKFKYIQHPALHASNQNILGLRTLALAEKNVNNNWRDPLTGWTKSDAKQVIQQGEQEQQNYENQLQQIRKKNEQQLEESKRRLQQEIDFSNHMTRLWLLKLS